MGFHRWLGAILISSMFVFAGCTEQSTPTPGTSPATTSTEQTETGQETGQETGDDSSTIAKGEPPTGDPLADLEENADGMDGFEEVRSIEVVASSADSIAKGKELFSANCASCHGDDGSGGGPAAAALDPPPRNLHKSGEYKYGFLDLSVYRTVAYGIEGTGMAPWDGILTPEQMWNLVHYVRSEQTG